MSVKKALLYGFTIAVILLIATLIIGHLWVFIILVATTLIGIAVNTANKDKKTEIDKTNEE